MYTYFKTETGAAQNLINDFFSNWLSEDPSIGRILSEKKYRGTELLSEEKQRLCMQNLTKERKQPTVVTLQESIIYNILLGPFEDPIKVFSSLVFLHIFFSTILIMVTEQLCWRKVLCGCFCIIWLWLLLAIMKRCAERCALQLYRTSLSRNTHGQLKISLQQEGI